MARIITGVIVICMMVFSFLGCALLIVIAVGNVRSGNFTFGEGVAMGAWGLAGILECMIMVTKAVKE